MYNSTNLVYKVRQNGLEKIIKFMNSDMIFIPKSILCREAVYEGIKMLFSIIFTHSLQNHLKDRNICLTVIREMKKILGAISDEDIQLNCFCTRSRVGIIKSEVLYIINHENISNCIRETGKGAV